MTEDEMVGWHHRLNGHGFGWTLRVGDGQGGLACCRVEGTEYSSGGIDLWKEVTIIFITSTIVSVSSFPHSCLTL